jgi:hypothetical protein
VPETLGRLLAVPPSVDRLERMHLKMAAPVRSLRESRPPPAPEEAGALGVVRADGQGMPRRRPAPEAPSHGHAPAPEANTNRQTRAVGGPVYTMDPWVRTPEEVATALWQSPAAAPPPLERPVPKPQRLWASRPHHPDHHEGAATEPTWGGLAQAVGSRHPRADQPMLVVLDGPKALGDTGQRAFPTAKTSAMRDLGHAPPRRGDAAPLFSGRDEAPALRLVDDRVLRLLQGAGRSVVAGLRQMGTKRQRRSTQRDTRTKRCAALANKAQRRRDEGYLAAGSPMASGGIAGACRHGLTDRRERSGMRWTLERAQARLDRRRTDLNGEWDDFMRYRIGQETQRLYPYRALVEPRAALDEIDLPIAA